MLRRFSLLACLVAVFVLAVPASAHAAQWRTSPAALPGRAGLAPAAQPSASAVVLAPAPEQAPLTAEEVTVSTPGGQPLAGLRVRGGSEDLFTVLCRAWEAQPGAGALGAPGTSWFYSDRPGAAAALNLAGRLPLVGHACAVTRDPSPANIARLALDVVTVIVFVQMAAHALPEITGVAVAMTHAPGALAGAGILLEQGPGIVATIRGGMDQVQRLDNLGDEMQARLRADAAAQVAQPQDLNTLRGPANEPLATPAELPASPDGTAPAAKRSQQADAANASANRMNIAAAANAAGAAVLSAASQGIAGAGGALGTASQDLAGAQQALGTTGQVLWQNARRAGAETASAAVDTSRRLGAGLQNACVELPFARLGCQAPALPGD